MMEHFFSVSLGGVSLPCAARYDQTEAYFRPFQAEASSSGCSPVRISDTEWLEYMDEGLVPCAHTEYSLLTPCFADRLMEQGNAIVHAVALRWRDNAYLLCAPSGVGKSTQTRFLQELRPGEFSVICGDRPILQFCHNDVSRDKHCLSAGAQCSSLHSVPATEPTGKRTILVHPSPWNGKEDWHGANTAPLAGVILLSRGSEDRLFSLSAKEAGIPLFMQFIYHASTAELVKAAASFTTMILENVPAWRLESNRPPASTELLLNAVFSESDHNLK